MCESKKLIEKGLLFFSLEFLWCFIVHEVEFINVILISIDKEVKRRLGGLLCMMRTLFVIFIVLFSQTI